MAETHESHCRQIPPARSGEDHRDRALKAIHELRALAHIVDMHQLTKDPESYAGQGQHKARIRKRAMTPFELNRYLDYCSDALALISKIAALYVQGFQDPVLLDAVDDVEDLTAGSAQNLAEDYDPRKHAPCAARRAITGGCRREPQGECGYGIGARGIWGEHPIGMTAVWG